MFQQLRSLSTTELRSAWMLLIYGFGNAGAYVVARAVADSAFLSRVGPDRLPMVFLVAAGGVALVSAVYGQIVRGTPLLKTVQTTLLILAASSAAIPLLVHSFPSSTLAMAIVYLLAQIRGSLGTIQFTMLINDQFSGRKPERIVGFVALGPTIAGFSLGLTIGYFFQSADTINLMYLAATIDLLTVIPIMFLPKILMNREVIHPHDRDTSASEKHIPTQQNYVFHIALMVALGVVVTTFVEYQWKVEAAVQFHRDENAMAHYFGYFYAWVYLSIGLLQVFGTSRLLVRRQGVLIGLMVLPAALLTTGIYALSATTQRMLFWTISFAKGSDALKRALNDPTVQVLYGPIGPSKRHQAITFVSGITKPLAEAATAIGLIILSPVLSPQLISIPVILFSIGWISINVWVYRAYRQRSKKDISPKTS
ncbi:MAG: hypothetical protein P8N76_05745 [Pirellulaceae bacterium]|nr:hypothetical protein [Pirellulaceae bacterium]